MKPFPGFYPYLAALKSVNAGVIFKHLISHRSPSSSSSLTPSRRGSGQPRLPSVMAASPLTVAVSCGLDLNCAAEPQSMFMSTNQTQCVYLIWHYGHGGSLEHAGWRSAVRVREVYGPLNNGEE